MSLQYRDLAYARQRLEGTIVNYQGRPVKILEIQKKSFLYTEIMQNYIKTGEDWKDLDLTPVRLGNVNFGTQVVYTYRLPKRQDWRQGLRDRTLKVYGKGVLGKFNMLSPDLYKTIVGMYPNVENCMDSLENGEAIARAFSRNFSLTKRKEDFLLVFKNKKVVGKVDLNNDGGIACDLENKYWFLEEMYKEEVH